MQVKLRISDGRLLDGQFLFFSVNFAWMTAQKETHLFNWLKTELGNLPGEVAHRDMIPYRVTVSEALRKPITYRLSAVLLLLYLQDGVAHFILIKRQKYKGKHSGQISFPGGKVEESDANTEETALRETHEEIGVPPKDIQILGRLTQVYIPVSNFLIHPYIGVIDELPELVANPREVHSILHCSISDLLNEDKLILTKLKTDKGVWMKDIPAFDLGDKVVWGATAIILNEFKYILQRRNFA